VHVRVEFTRNVGARPDVDVVHYDPVVQVRLDGDRQLVVGDDVIGQVDAHTQVGVPRSRHRCRWNTQRFPQHACTHQTNNFMAKIAPAAVFWRIQPNAAVVSRPTGTATW